jgi:hypothetical protein
VYAWDDPPPPSPACLDIVRYNVLFLRAAATILGPFGLPQAALRDQLFSTPVAYQMSMTFGPIRRFSYKNANPSPR